MYPSQPNDHGIDHATSARPFPVSYRITLLLVAHFLFGILSAVLSEDQPSLTTCIFFSLVFCQTSLLGMWCGLGQPHWLLRCVALVVGTVYLGYLLGWGIDEVEAEIFFVVSVATGVVALSTWVVKCTRARLGRVGEMDSATTEGLQFSIMHLMLLTFVVASMITVGKLLAPYLNNLDQTTELAALALCFVSVAVVAIWAMLGVRSPGLRVPFVFLVAPLAGWVGAYALDGRYFTFWIATTSVQSLFLVASLWIVRSDGLRLLARAQQK